jgi:hypothetical protein
MEIAASSGPVEADVTAFAVLDPVGELPDLDPRLQALVDSGEIQGTAGATCVLHGEDGRIVAAGGGRRDQLDVDSIRDAAAGVARLGLGGTVAWVLDDSLGVDVGEQARGRRRARFGGYDPVRGRRAPRRAQTERLILVGGDERTVSWRSGRSRCAVGEPRRDLSAAAERPPLERPPTGRPRSPRARPSFLRGLDLDQIPRWGGAFAAVEGATGNHA